MLQRLLRLRGGLVGPIGLEHENVTTPWPLENIDGRTNRTRLAHRIADSGRGRGEFFGLGSDDDLGVRGDWPWHIILAISRRTMPEKENKNKVAPLPRHLRFGPKFKEQKRWVCFRPSEHNYRFIKHELQNASKCNHIPSPTIALESLGARTVRSKRGWAHGWRSPRPAKQEE